MNATDWSRLKKGDRVEARYATADGTETEWRIVLVVEIDRNHQLVRVSRGDGAAASWLPRSSIRHCRDGVGAMRKEPAPDAEPETHQHHETDIE